MDTQRAAWAFLLDFYRRADVADACLTLQDAAGIDVVEMLVLVYADVALGRRLGAGQAAGLRAAMEGWRRDAVLSLRAIRRALKPARADVAEADRESLRADVKKAELTAERLQVELAARWLDADAATGGGPGLAAALDALVPAERRGAEVAAALARIVRTAEAVRAERPA